MAKTRLDYKTVSQTCATLYRLYCSVSHVFITLNQCLAKVSDLNCVSSHGRLLPLRQNIPCLFASFDRCPQCLLKRIRALKGLIVQHPGRKLGAGCHQKDIRHPLWAPAVSFTRTSPLHDVSRTHEWPIDDQECRAGHESPESTRAKDKDDPRPRKPREVHTPPRYDPEDV